MPISYDFPGSERTPIFRLHEVPPTQLQILLTLVILHVLDRHNACLQCRESDPFTRKSWGTILQNMILQRVCKKYAAPLMPFKLVGKIVGRPI